MSGVMVTGASFLETEKGGPDGPPGAPNTGAAPARSTPAARKILPVVHRLACDYRKNGINIRTDAESRSYLSAASQKRRIQRGDRTMNKSLPLALLFMALSTPAAAQSVFDGTWKGDVAASQLSTKPSIFAVSGGKYTCATCKPTISIPADGAFHAVSDSPYYDEVAVAVVDPATLKRSARKGGKLVGETTMTLSTDGKTMTSAFSDTSADNGTPVTGTQVSERVAPAPAGAHALSGSWRATNSAQVSDSGLTFTFKQTGKTLSYSSPTGISYTATIGGEAAPVTGDPGWTWVKLKQSGANTLVETDLYRGKPIGVYTMTVSADGKTMTTQANDLKFGKKSTLVATKQ
jgi:hypothetical protein